jgi:SAM-dependent methyltransferase
MTKGNAGKILSSRVYPEFFPIGAGDLVLHAGCGNGAQIMVYGNTGEKQFGLDIQESRIGMITKNAREAGINNFEGLVDDLEKLEFSDGYFDKIIAVDIIQHVKSPARALAEMKRVLKPDGRLLLTFPAWQHYWLTRLSAIKNGNKKTGDWNPDEFNHNLCLGEWLKIAKTAGWELVRSHATTLWPPLHRYGIPRFWFSNNFIHRLDYFFGGLPVLKKYGQALMCIYKIGNELLV